MKIKFDSNQRFQLDAINAIVDLFEGQPIEESDFTTAILMHNFLGQEAQTGQSIGNKLFINSNSILSNLRRVQNRNRIDGLNIDDVKNFSVEMETGTGKTYVYLRTIFELNKKYGFKKFIIVVPSVAVREGVSHSLKTMKEHFRDIYNNPKYDDPFVYDSKKINQLKSFASSDFLQIMIINIDAFNKKDRAVIYQEIDKMNSNRPIDYIKRVNPFVIIDEPQSVDNTDVAKDAINELNPLCIFRYSATHRNLHNLVYKLDPIKAYEMGLVKQIVVASTQVENSANQGYVRLNSVDNKNGLIADLSFFKKQKESTKLINKKVKYRDDLYELSSELDIYKENFVITEISAEPNNEYLIFNNGLRINLGQELGPIRDEILKLQIKSTIQKHLEKELSLLGKGIKVLSLFFIDAVSNYREYDEKGNPSLGKFAKWFEEIYKDFLKQDRYKSLSSHSVNQVHNGYFSKDQKTGKLKDSSETKATQADFDAYKLIMEEKEVLLSLDTPLRFIFSHSALREGWDNPNVFQICTLNETKSVIKKRQEIGRGLRLPVNQNGERVFDKNINKLLVIANESYEEFASKLQKEYEDECGITFGKILEFDFIDIEIKDQQGNIRNLTQDESREVFKSIKASKLVNDKNQVANDFDFDKASEQLKLPEKYEQVKDQILTIVETRKLKNHIKDDNDSKTLKINKRVFLDEDFKALWDQIKHKTRYSIEYSSQELVQSCIKSIKLMQAVEPLSAIYKEAFLSHDHSGIEAIEQKSQVIDIKFIGALPDIVSYIQRETELTRSTIVKILTECERLQEFTKNPQKFMEVVTHRIKHELNSLIITGIKYEKISGNEYDMRLFEEVELTGYLNQLYEAQNHVYDYVQYDSDIERKFAQGLDSRTDIKLYAKLPAWFKIDTPIGTYNPDWAIVKEGDKTLYLVRETKGTTDLNNLRGDEKAKVECGMKHFKELGVDFKLVKTAGEV